jgi:hypothetical protein
MIFGMCPLSSVKNTQRFEGRLCLRLQERVMGTRFDGSDGKSKSHPPKPGAEVAFEAFCVSLILGDGHSLEITQFVS